VEPIHSTRHSQECCGLCAVYRHHPQLRAHPRARQREPRSLVLQVSSYILTALENVRDMHLVISNISWFVIDSPLHRCTSVESDQAVMISRNVMRTLMVVGTAVVAISAPYFGSVLGTVGGLTDALQSFVLPPLICLSTMGMNKVPLHTKVIYMFIVLWGTGTILYTLSRLTHSTFQNLYADV
jgi:Transmembrane amino acid transporter protein